MTQVAETPAWTPQTTAVYAPRNMMGHSRHSSVKSVYWATAPGLSTRAVLHYISGHAIVWDQRWNPCTMINLPSFIIRL